MQTVERVISFRANKLNISACAENAQLLNRRGRQIVRAVGVHGVYTEIYTTTDDFNELLEKYLTFLQR